MSMEMAHGATVLAIMAGSMAAPAFYVNVFTFFGEAAWIDTPRAKGHTAPP
jgi:hypothetical protein